MGSKKSGSKKRSSLRVGTYSENIRTLRKGGKIGFLSLWKTYILTNIRKNTSTEQALRDYNMYRSTNATMSGKQKIAFYFTIDGYPGSLPIDFRESIRREASGQTRVSFVSSFEPTNINWYSPTMKSKLRVWQNIDEESEEVTNYNYYKNITSMDSLDRRRQSLVYLADAEIRRKRNLFKYRTLMIVTGVRGSDFDRSIANILEYAKNIELKITRITDGLEEFLHAFSPFSFTLDGGVLKQVGNSTIVDEQLSRLSSYSQGKIGTKGIIFGTDIFSNFPVYKQVKKSDTDAENILITAETGGGKSFFMKWLLIQLLALSEYNGTINDIEGSEYTPLAGFVANNDEVIILNMAEGSGSYYDPFEIVTTGIPDLDDKMFATCKSFTNSYFRVLVGEELLKNNSWAQKIVNNAISLAYTDLGVSASDPDTWANTKGYDLFYVYSKFKALYEEARALKDSNADLDLHQVYKTNEGYIDTLDLVVAKLSEYFEPFERGGIRSDVFAQKVNLSDIVDAKLLVNSFGMEGRSADTVDTTQMALAQLSAANISYIRSVFSKAQGKFNFKVWEEFQRWGQFPGSATTIKTAITGGRKLGDINIIATNNVKDLLDNDVFGIFDNITTFAVGAIASDQTRERLCKELSVPQLKPELDAIVNKKGNIESLEGSGEMQSIYNKAFLINLDRSVTTIVKAILPPEVGGSYLFKTGVDVRDAVDDEDDEE